MLGEILPIVVGQRVHPPLVWGKAGDVTTHAVVYRAAYALSADGKSCYLSLDRVKGLYAGDFILLGKSVGLQSLTLVFFM